MTTDTDLLDREFRQDLSIDELLNIEDLCVVFEACRRDADNVPFYIYTVGGRLDGAVVGTEHGGALIGGQCIIVHGRSRREADALAYEGLEDSIKAEEQNRLERMRTVLGDRPLVVGGTPKLDTDNNAGIIASVDALSERKH